VLGGGVGRRPGGDAGSIAGLAVGRDSWGERAGDGRDRAPPSHGVDAASRTGTPRSLVVALSHPELNPPRKPIPGGRRDAPTVRHDEYGRWATRLSYHVDGQMASQFAK